ncbi:hypothetical protein [Dokdonella ginsengisoli]|uniref:Chemotaxis protein n=1 Tax=Dokdonella ginsengisoli TaxID=363846 RepID=A0ABV9R1S2_9GAMM
MDSFSQAIGNLLLVHARVRALDRNALSERRRVQRAEQMRALRRSADALVTKTFSDLSEAGKASAAELDAAAGELERDLRAQKTAVQLLDAVGSGLSVIARLLALLV